MPSATKPSPVRDSFARFGSRKVSQPRIAADRPSRSRSRRRSSRPRRRRAMRRTTARRSALAAARAIARWTNGKGEAVVEAGLGGEREADLVLDRPRRAGRPGRRWRAPDRWGRAPPRGGSRWRAPRPSRNLAEDGESQDGQRHRDPEEPPGQAPRRHAKGRSIFRPAPIRAMMTTSSVRRSRATANPSGGGDPRQVREGEDSRARARRRRSAARAAAP